MEKYVFIETYGCSANKNNSEILAGILTSAGYKITNNLEIAKIVIINSCIVKGKTENKIKRRIQDISKLNKLLIVTGCMPETDSKQLKKLNKKIILLGTHHYKEIINLIKKNNENKLNWEEQNKYLIEKNEEKINLPKIPYNKLISIIQISEGCLGRCSYCKTRLAKGKLFSYNSENILKSIKNDLKQGAKEIWITSQDNASYNLEKDLGNILENHPQRLPELLKQILNLKHNFKLRLGMMNPNNLYQILNEMVEIYKHPKMYKFLHIPIQSASDKILKDMNRFYKIKKVKEIIKKFKKEIPNITIATDIIIGYPTETEKDFQKSLSFIKTYKPDVFNLSKFSSHKQTPAGRLKQLPINILNKRTTKIMKFHRQTALENKQRFKGKTIKVFVNKKIGEDLYESRDENYNIIIINSKEKILGKNLDVEIKKVSVHHMIGESVDKKIKKIKE